MEILSLLRLSLLVALSRSQELQIGNSTEASPIWALATDIENGKSTLCNKSFADANATGFFHFNPNIVQGLQAGQEGQTGAFTGQTSDALFAMTIANPGFANTSNSSSSLSYWYNTNGANYSDDISLGYDVCLLAGLSFNYNTQLRGQTDNGSCTSALDVACVSALKSYVEQWSTWLTTPSPGPNSNLTNTSLPGICQALSHQLINNVPTECSYFIQEKLDGIAWPLTSTYENFQTGLNPDCTINGTYQNFITFFNNASQSIYEAWIDSVTPALIVFMPVADASITPRPTEVVVELLCPHITDIKEDSYHPPAAPAPTPVAYNTSTNGTASDDGKGSTRLSGGAIAGIVVGVVAFTALVISGLVLWIQRKRWAKQQAAARPGQEKPIAEVTGETTRHELQGHFEGAQLPGEGIYRQELDNSKGSAEPVELPVSTPPSQAPL